MPRDTCVSRATWYTCPCVRSRATDTNTFNYWEFDLQQRTRPAKQRRTTPTTGRVREPIRDTRDSNKCRCQVRGWGRSAARTSTGHQDTSSPGPCPCPGRASPSSRRPCCSPRPEQWNVACFCVSNISSNSPNSSFRTTLIRIFARICQVLVNLWMLCLGLELDNDGWELWTSGPRSAEHWGDQLVSSTFAYLRILVSTLENFHFGFKLTVYFAPMQDLSWS